MSESVCVDLVDSDSNEPKEPWDEAYWIRPGEPHEYPASDIPLVVAEQRDLLVSLPPVADELLPPAVLSVAAFLNDWTYCPSPQQSTVVQKVDFSNEACDI